MRWLILLGVLGAAGVALWVLVTSLSRPPEQAQFSLPRPAPGEARADHLADGTPVWVIADEHGNVSVLSAISTHVPFGVAKLTWWCFTSRTVDDPFHGSTWDEYGVKLGGPAPSGLVRWSIQPTANLVFIGQPVAAPARGVRPLPADRTRCMSDDDPVVMHTFVGWETWQSPQEAVASTAAGWVLVEGKLVPQPDGTVALCSLAGCADSMPALGVEIPPANRLGHAGWRGGRHLVAVRDGQMRAVVLVVSR